jgi:hypothetical protein
VGYVLVVIVALAVGAAVYVSTIRGAMPWFDGQAQGGFRLPRPGAGSTSAAAEPIGVPVSSPVTDWQSRLTGVVGLLLAVIVAAVVLAASVYAVGAAIGSAVGDAATNGGVHRSQPLP